MILSGLLMAHKLSKEPTYIMWIQQWLEEIKINCSTVKKEKQNTNNLELHTKFWWFRFCDGL